jgi:hypothetical protein
MKNRLLAHAIVTREHSGVAQCWRALLSPASTNGTILAGDIMHPPAQMEAFALAGALCRPPTLCLCKINNQYLKQ